MYIFIPHYQRSWRGLVWAWTHNFHILCLIFIRLGRSVHHNKTMSLVYDPDLYAKGQGHMPRSNMSIFSTFFVQFLYHLTKVSTITSSKFNNASARRGLVDWYLSLFVMCKAWHQYNERLKALALLNSPQMMCYEQILGLYGQGHRSRSNGIWGWNWKKNMFLEQNFLIYYSTWFSYHMAQVSTITRRCVTYIIQVCMFKVKVTGHSEMENIFPQA